MGYRWPRWTRAGLLAALVTAFAPTAAWAADSAVVLTYHRFGENEHPSTNIRLEQFEAHLAHLRDGGYSVLPLPEILQTLRQGRPLPDRTVAITIDDAYLSVFEEAHPRLRAAGFPYTLFVATEPVDLGLRDYMDWEQVRRLRDDGVTIGSQSHSHAHMPARPKLENARDLARANRLFKSRLNAMPALFAYPFGEASGPVMETVLQAGHSAAFGQHSGVVHDDGDLFYLPRFALNETYGDMDRFRLVVDALPLPVENLTPVDPTIRVNPPPIGFTVPAEVGALDRLSCYASHDGALDMTVVDRRVEVRLGNPFPAGRTRINCTLPARDDRWRWFGYQWWTPREIGGQRTDAGTQR